jgi:hypothetical protein
MPSSTNHPVKSKDPYQIIRDFCRNYHYHEVQEMLWDWLVTAISRNNSIYDDGKERGSLFLLYENITLLVAAAYSVHQQPASTVAPAKATPNPKAPAKNKKPGTTKP